MISRSVIIFCVWASRSMPTVWAEAPTYLRGLSSKGYYSLKTGQDRIGKTETEWKAVPSGLRFVESSEIQMTLYKKAEHVTTRLVADTDLALQLLSIEYSFKSGQANIVVKGRRSGNKMVMSSDEMGKNRSTFLTLQEPVVVSSTIRPFLVMKGLPEVEVSHDISFLEPSAFAVVPMKMKVTKMKQQNRWKVVMEYLNQSMSSEIDSNGNLITESSDFAGLPVIAEKLNAKDFKAANITGTKEDLVERARVHFPRIEQSKELKRFSVHISGIDLSAFKLNRHRQKLVKNKLTVDIESVPTAGLSLEKIKLKTDLKKYLAADGQTPVDDPIIQKKASEIVGDEKDIWVRALKIHEFVHTTLTKEPTISVPNALQVLKSGRGDCNEHAVLYTALARAAGVPTRTVVGLVYSDRFYGDSGFYYHAWVEVNTGLAWVAIDPTWNQIPADATHMAFVEGGLDTQLQITSLMGKIRLEP